jgi:hypothetical protein
VTERKRRLLGMGIPFGLAFLPSTALAVFNPTTFEVGDRLFFHGLYQIHPTAVVAGYLIWGAIVVSLIVMTPELLAMMVTIAAVFGHLGGVYSHLNRALGGAWYQAANGMMLVAAAAVGTGIWWSAGMARRSGDNCAKRRSPSWLRWGFIVVLLAAAGGIILAPWGRSLAR